MLYGNGLLVITLCCDAMLGNYQEKAMKVGRWVCGVCGGVIGSR